MPKQRSPIHSSQSSVPKRPNNRQHSPLHTVVASNNDKARKAQIKDVLDKVMDYLNTALKAELTFVKDELKELGDEIDDNDNMKRYSEIVQLLYDLHMLDGDFQQVKTKLKESTGLFKQGDVLRRGGAEVNALMLCIQQQDLEKNDMPQGIEGDSLTFRYENLMNKLQEIHRDCCFSYYNELDEQSICHEQVKTDLLADVEQLREIATSMQGILGTAGTTGVDESFGKACTNFINKTKEYENLVDQYRRVSGKDQFVEMMVSRTYVQKTLSHVSTWTA